MFSSLIIYIYVCFVFFFFKQKTAYEMRISDWSSDVCSSDLSSIIRIGYIDEKYFSGKAGAESHIQRLHFDITPSLDILLEPIAQGNCDMLGSQRGHLSPLAASARFNSVVSGPISFGADPCRRISSAPASRNAINWSAHCAAVPTAAPSSNHCCGIKRLTSTSSWRV